MTDKGSMGLSLTWRSAIVATLVTAACALGAGAANAVTLHAPRGIVPARGASAPSPGVRTRGAYRRAPQRSLPAGATPALLYHGGGVMHSSHVYTIFWQPQSLPAEVSAFEASPSYQATVNGYFRDVAHDDGLSSNVFSVASQYYDLSGPGGAKRYANYSVQHESADSYLDPEQFPASSCTDKSDINEAESLPVCLSAEQLATEIAKVIVLRGWTAGASSIFMIYTPQGVGSCFNAGESSTVATDSCAYTGKQGYCAYHSYFAATGLPEVIFANLPYGATPNCDDAARPGGSHAGPVIDSGSHEHVEAVTDPTGEAWYDSVGEEATNADYGQEIGDLCVSSGWESQYGPLFTGSSGYGSPGAFNQLISGSHYLLQREWNNAAGATQGACAQRLIPASFTVLAGARVAQPVSFDGSASGSPEDPVVSWSWNFGDGSAGSGAAVSHTYAAAGADTVTLTVTDANGNSDTAVRQVSVLPPSVTPAPEEPVHGGSSPPAPAPAPPRAVLPSPLVTSPVHSAPAPLSSVELSTLLGLPSTGATLLAGTGAILLGHASCSPACSLTARLYASVPGTRHGRRVKSRRLVGTAHLSASAGVATAIAVKLNALGRALLRANRRLSVQLVISVTDRQGATRLLRSSFTLTAPAGAPRRRR